MNYSATMGRGWAIVWKNKWLLLLGFILTLGGMLSFLYGLSLNFPTDPNEITPEMAAAFLGRLGLMSCLLLVVSLILAVVNLAARGGLITGVAGVERGETYGFGCAFGAGWRKVLPLIGMSLLLYGAIFILYLILIFGFIATIMFGIALSPLGNDMGQVNNMGILGVLGICCLAVALFVLSVFVRFLYPFAFRGIMLRDLGVIDAIRHGWRTLRENLGEILLLALPFFVLTALLYLLYYGVYFAISFQSMGDIFANPGAMPALNTFSPALIAVYVVYAILYALLGTWQSSTFTLAYMQWTGKDVLTGGVPPLPAEPRPPAK